MDGLETNVVILHAHTTPDMMCYIHIYLRCDRGRWRCRRPRLVRSVRCSSCHRADIETWKE